MRFPQEVSTMKQRGFGLVEVLILVAAAGVLAAIAVPNSIEADVRAKVARTKARFGIVHTALEAYYLDHRDYPIDGSWIDDRSPYWYLPNHITHPIAYMTGDTLADPFREGADVSAAMAADAPDSALYSPVDYRRFRYRYFEYTYGKERGLAPQYIPPLKDVFGKWAVNSVGPDGLYGPTRSLVRLGLSISVNVPYDPSNGTVSWGDIVRCPKYPQGDLPAE